MPRERGRSCPFPENASPLILTALKSSRGLPSPLPSRPPPLPPSPGWPSLPPPAAAAAAVTSTRTAMSALKPDIGRTSTLGNRKNTRAHASGVSTLLQIAPSPVSFVRPALLLRPPMRCATPGRHRGEHQQTCPSKLQQLHLSMSSSRNATTTGGVGWRRRVGHRHARRHFAGSMVGRPVRSGAQRCAGRLRWLGFRCDGELAGHSDVISPPLRTEHALPRNDTRVEREERPDAVDIAGVASAAKVVCFSAP